jgi:transposase-like protein
MTPVQPAIAVPSATCPLCHTLDHTVTSESLLAGVGWVCTRCGGKWTAARLETAAAYQRYVAAQ